MTAAFSCFGIWGPKAREILQPAGPHLAALLVGAGQDLDPVYRRVLDPMLTLAYAAACTRTIRLGVYAAQESAWAPLAVGQGAVWVPVTR